MALITTTTEESYKDWFYIYFGLRGYEDKDINLLVDLIQPVNKRLLELGLYKIKTSYEDLDYNAEDLKYNRYIKQILNTQDKEQHINLLLKAVLWNRIQYKIDELKELIRLLERDLKDYSAIMKQACFYYRDI